MSDQKLLFIALLGLMLTVAWSLPSQSLNTTATTSSTRRQLIKDFVAKVQELISILMKQLLSLPATK
ncbi:uncharacterized protein LOC108103543 [Drosophila eugracilis]|uniref:uncharacterized protein LOC108103543 n=1 Tax=Drosophila eugracilis TaxID=29029 RepID=UPI0007E7EAD0|nr:uncharacterized protein LOC108103543 [Drosophila eugracilis]